MTGRQASATVGSLEWDSTWRQRPASICTSATLLVKSPMSVRTLPSSLQEPGGCCHLLPSHPWPPAPRPGQRATLATQCQPWADLTNFC